MILGDVRQLAAAVCLMLVVCVGDVASQDTTGAAKSIDGLWSGTWGGGQRDGVVFQPVLAELLIKGDHLELCGFRNLDRVTGTVRLDARTKRMQITPAANSAGSPKPQDIEFTYAIDDDELTLTDTDKVAVSLRRRRVAQNPLANLQTEVVTATGINDAGDLLVTEYRVLRARPGGGEYYQPQDRSLKTKQATVLLVQEAGLRKLGLDEARERIRMATPVVITYRHDEQASPHQFSGLVQDVG